MQSCASRSVGLSVPFPCVPLQPSAYVSEADQDCVSESEKGRTAGRLRFLMLTSSYLLASRPLTSLAMLRTSASSLARSLRLSPSPLQAARCYSNGGATGESSPGPSSSSSRSGGSSSSSSDNDPETHFGFQSVPEALKESMVGGVFSSVSSSYDVMNDASEYKQDCSIIHPCAHYLVSLAQCPSVSIVCGRTISSQRYLTLVAGSTV